MKAERDLREYERITLGGKMEGKGREKEPEGTIEEIRKNER